MDSLNTLKPWAVMSMLNTEAVAATLEARGTKASAALGVEEQVRKLGGGKPEAWLEDTRAELEVLDGLSPALQESLLRSTCCVILNPDSATGMDAVIDRWPIGGAWATQKPLPGPIWTAWPPNQIRTWPGNTTQHW